MAWLNLIVLLALVAGNCELCVALVNRIHARPYRRRVLKLVRQAHDVWMLAFPILVLWCVGLAGPQLLGGGSWADVPAGWLAYFGLCALGVVGLCVAVVCWRLHRPPGALVANHGRVVDIAGRLGYRPTGRGPHRGLLRVPGNEILQLELNEKTFALPRLPAAWDGLSILHLSDFHFTGAVDRPYFEELVRLASETPADLLVFTGDLIDDRRLIDWIPATLGRLDAPLGRFFILGNHDWVAGAEPVRAAVTNLGWTDVASRTVTVEHRGHQLAIGGTERPWMGCHPDFSAAPAGAFRLLLSHTPDNLAWARRAGVDLMLSGHNHGGQVVLPVIGPVYSPSRYGVQYAGGSFWREPTLLHVSRGVGGKHPLRINCRPEVTRIVLRVGVASRENDVDSPGRGGRR